MLKPDYNGDCIINVNKEVKKQLNSNKKVVLIIIDSLGYFNLIKMAKHSKCLSKSLKRFKIKMMTSVFPTTTVAAMSAIISGQTTQEHGLYEWLIYSKRLNMRFFPFKFLPTEDEDIKRFKRTVTTDLIKTKKILKNLNITSYEIIPEEILNGKSGVGLANKIGYSNITDAFAKLRKAIINENKKSLFLLYLPYFDESEHTWGPYSDESMIIVKEMFHLIEEEVLNRLKSTKVIITADHGCIDIKSEIKLDKKTWFWKYVWKNLDKNKGKKILPVGSPRDLFLHVKKEREDFVIDILNKKLGKYAEIVRVDDMLKNGFFGIGKINKRFLDDVGNIIILPKKNYAVTFYGKEPFEGMHGGLSKEELFVPLMISK